ncbi:MAG: hypothetical protein K6B65_01145 [Bacilli bacterium]|nr:hypothetical protein [Bacilli bacterium]
MKKVIFPLASLTLMMTLASCGGSPATSSTPAASSSQEATTSSAEASSSKEENPYADYKTLKDFERGGSTYTDSKGQEVPLTRHTLEANAGSPCLPSLGEQRILVVPLGLDDDTITSPAYPSIVASGRTDMQTEERLEQIENIFFGEADGKGWQSLKSFYETSSFGNLTITGQVMKQDGGWYRPGKKPKDYSSTQALNDIKTFYTTEYSKENHGALGEDAHEWTWFDQDKDGYIDTIWIVYSAPIHAYEPSATSSNYWAYVSRTNKTASKASPNPMCYAWASIDFMDQGGYEEGTDFHTFIHETGHIFGIDDYYSYDDTEAPLGGIDLMDHNIGDHNAFSKWQYGWSQPYVVDDSAYIEMEPTTTSGDSVIIPAPDWNGTCYDEYMLIEFISPVGLCSEYKGGYSNTTGYTKPGLRITHVDGRAYKSKNTEILSTPEEVATATTMRVMNTPSGRGYPQWKDTFTNKETGTDRSMYMINIMQASGFSKDNNLLVMSGTSTNNDLYTKGFTFDLTPYYDSSLKADFNDWYYLMPSYSNLWNKAQDPLTREVDETCTFNYTVEVLDVTKEKVKFVIEKLD